jgi:hypothetical protein
MSDPTGPSLPGRGAAGGNLPTDKGAAGGGTGTQQSMGSQARARRPAAGSIQTLIYGRDEVKVFPVNEYQLSLLGQNRGWAGVCFTLAGILFGFAMNIWVSTDLSSGVSPLILTRWQVIEWAALAASIVFAIFGVAFLGFGHAVIRKIWKRTKFE